MAHNSLPVSAIFVDPWSIEKVGKLCAVSVGRDEKLNFWDGLLANDWVGKSSLFASRLVRTFLMNNAYQTKNSSNAKHRIAPIAN
jgi:hypothetical protein